MCNRIFGARYLTDQKKYLFPAYQPFLKDVVNDLAIVFPDLQWSEEATAHSKLYSNNSTFSALDPAFTFPIKPFDHQRHATLFAVQNYRCGILAAPGLGKTKIAIDAFRYLRQFENIGLKALVICPAVILYKWAEEIKFHSGSTLIPVVIDGTPAKKKKLLNQPGDMYICTYGTASSLEEEISDTIPYGMCIVDESQNLMTYNSQKTKAATSLGRKAYRRIMMSGTAALGDPRHLYGQLDFLAPFLHEDNYWKFCQKYLVYKQRATHNEILGFKNLSILNARLNKVSVQYTKEQCLDLPPRTFVTIPYSISSEQKEIYNLMVNADQTELGEMLKVVPEATAPTRLTKLSQILSGFLRTSNKELNKCDGCPHLNNCVENSIQPYTRDCKIVQVAPPSTDTIYAKNGKLEALMALLDMQLLDPSNKTIIWCHFLKELDIIEETLAKAGYQSVRVDGSVSGLDVQIRVKEFQTNSDCKVFIGQIASGVGIDLTAANYMIYYSLDYDLGHYLQSMDRSYRIGQTRNVTVYTLIYPGSVEEAMYGALQNKEEIRSALTNRSAVIKSKYVKKLLSPEEIK